MDTLLLLRVLVSIGVIALTCTKHIRFSGLVTEPNQQVQTISEETMSVISPISWRIFIIKLANDEPEKRVETILRKVSLS
jgi:hypothetical protein